MIAVPRALTSRAFVAFALFLTASQSVAEDERETVGIAPEVAEFDDWSVSCDNTKRCEAIGLSRALAAAMKQREWGEAAFHMLRVTREAGPTARPRVFVDRRVWGEPPTDTRTRLTLHVEDPTGERIGRAYRLLPVRNGQQELDPRDVDAFLAESVKSAQVQTRHSDLQGVASTKGMTAAIRYIDEAQGRRGNVTAIFGKGPTPAALVPAGRSLRRILLIKGIPGQRNDGRLNGVIRHRGSAICGVGLVSERETAYPLANGDTLWRVDCAKSDSADATIGQRAAWLVQRPDGQYLSAGFPRPEQGRVALHGPLPNSSFDPVSGLLTATLYYASRRDCGWRRQWGWNGKAWQLVSGRELHGCLGVMPDSWLITWRTGSASPP